ncbi:hypothetical protein EDC01DRAFT_627966 [Geopyxis carbonaria]|nr:hypothetical protein EDC01DRAFT_627966 [Geopyxis carbonaria]
MVPTTSGESRVLTELALACSRVAHCTEPEQGPATAASPHWPKKPTVVVHALAGAVRWGCLRASVENGMVKGELGDRGTARRVQQRTSCMPAACPESYQLPHTMSEVPTMPDRLWLTALPVTSMYNAVVADVMQGAATGAYCVVYNMYMSSWRPPCPLALRRDSCSILQSRAGQPFVLGGDESDNFGGGPGRTRTKMQISQLQHRAFLVLVFLIAAHYQTSAGLQASQQFLARVQSCRQFTRANPIIRDGSCEVASAASTEHGPNPLLAHSRLLE